MNLLLDRNPPVQVRDERETRVVFLEVAEWTGVQSQQIGGVLKQFGRPFLQPTSSFSFFSVPLLLLSPGLFIVFF